MTPLFLYFAHEYLVAGTFEGQQATFTAFASDGFLQIPLFFEVKNSTIYPISAFAFHHAKGRQVYGNLWQGIEQNADFELHSNHFPIVNLLTDTLQDLKEKYLQTHQQPPTAAVQVVLVLPFDLTPKVIERLQKFLKENLGFKILQTTHAVANLLTTHTLLLQSIGEQALHFLHQTPEKPLTLQTLPIIAKETAAKVAKLVVEQALKNSSTNSGEAEKDKLIAHYTGEARRWIEDVKQRGTCQIRIEFSDGYAGEVLLSKEQIDSVELDNNLIVKKINQLDFVHNFQKIILAGNLLQNQVLVALLSAQIGGARLQLLNDQDLQLQIFEKLYHQWQQQQQEQGWQQLQQKIKNLIQEQNGELTATQQAEIEQVAKKYNLSLTAVQDLIMQEAAKIIFTAFEPVGETTLYFFVKAKHKQHGWVLMKALKDKYLQNAEYRNRLKVEYDWLKTKMQHPQLANAVAYSSAEENALYYLTEWLGGTPMNKLALPLANTTASHDLIKKYALQLAAALQQLHQFHWYHAKLNDQHLFIENEQVKLTSSKVEYAAAQYIGSKQQQNIKEFGVILLQFLTGKTTPQALQLLTDEKQLLWKPIIQRTNGGSSGSPYQTMQEVAAAIEQLRFETPKPPKTKFSFGKFITILKGALVAGAIVALVWAGAKYYPTTKTWVQHKLHPPAPNAECVPFKQIYTGTYAAEGKKDLIIGLQILDSQPQENKVCVFTYHLRIQQPDGSTLQERNQRGQVFIEQGRMRFENSTLGNVTFSIQKGKIVIAVDKFGGVELK